MTDNRLQESKCSICNSNYEDIRIGKKHIFGRCPKCERLDEIGLVF